MDGYLVSVQVDESFGLPRSLIVGNVSASVREALDRCAVALKNGGMALPPRRLTINLQPADIRKDGTWFDLPILTGMLKAMGMAADFPLSDYGFFGEVGLDGQIRHVRGTLSLVACMKEAGYVGAVVPEEDVQEALVVEGMDIIGIKDVGELLDLLKSENAFRTFPRPSPERQEKSEKYDYDFSEVRGQEYAVRAAMIAAAGNHDILLSGTAGSGKTMIAKRIPGIIPPLSREDDIEITKIYSVAGMLPKGSALYGRRPFRAPHHTITTAALLGGSSQGGIMPGELALAHKGVLFLDELPLFSRASIEALRQPLEDRKVLINRLQGSFSYPAECMLVAAMNPCPCGYYPDRNRCKCTPWQIRAYQRGISRPILERIDLCVEVSPPEFRDAVEARPSLSSAKIRERVIQARKRQASRFEKEADVRVNGRMGIREIEKFCPLSENELDFMKKIYTLKGLSMRTYHKILKVARTIADLEESENISIRHLSEAVSYRSLEDRLYLEEGADGIGGQRNDRKR